MISLARWQRDFYGLWLGGLLKKFVGGCLAHHSLIGLVDFDLTVIKILLTSGVVCVASLAGLSGAIRSTCDLTMRRLTNSTSGLCSTLRGSGCSTSPRVLSGLSNRIIGRSTGTGTTLLSLPLGVRRLSGARGFLSRINTCSRCLTALTTGGGLSCRSCLALRRLYSRTRGLERGLCRVRSRLCSDSGALSRLFGGLRTNSFMIRNMSNVRSAFSRVPGLVCSNPCSSRVLRGAPRVAGSTGPISSRRTIEGTTMTSNIPR